MRRQTTLYVGVAHAEKSEGVYLCRFDGETGKIEVIEAYSDAPSALWLTAHPRSNVLYAAGAPRNAEIHAFRIAADTGELTFLNTRDSHGRTPCYLSVDATGRFLLSANYSGGTAAVFPIEEDGSVGEASEVARREGSGPHPKRQEEPHPHSIMLSLDNRFALVADLGADFVAVYRFDGDAGRLIPNAPPGAPTAPGAGPRHLVFHPNGRFVYAINELDNTLTPFSWEPASGTLSALRSASTLPADFSGESFAAAVVATSDGRFLYASNRGHDSIAVFAADATTGALERVAIEPCLGECPTSLAISPTGQWLVAANQRSDGVMVFRMDTATGRLSPVGDPVPIPAPTSLAFL